jgi:hypothetical protein
VTGLAGLVFHRHVVQLDAGAAAGQQHREQACKNNVSLHPEIS